MDKIPGLNRLCKRGGGWGGGDSTCPWGQELSLAVITIGSHWPERHLVSNLSERRSTSPAALLMGLFL